MTILMVAIVVVLLGRITYVRFEEKRMLEKAELFRKRLDALQSTWPVARSVEECKRLNGKLIEHGGFDGADRCAIPTGDSGKACTRNSDCEAFCDVGQGVCHSEFSYVGHCFAIAFEDGKSSSLCVD